MNINLYKNWYLKTDQLNYTLYTKELVEDSNSKNNGEEYEKIEGYYTTIEGALRGMCSKEIKASKCTTLNGLVEEVRKLRRVIERLCREIGADYIVQDVKKMQNVDIPQPEQEEKGKKKKSINKTK